MDLQCIKQRYVEVLEKLNLYSIFYTFNTCKHCIRKTWPVNNDMLNTKSKTYNYEFGVNNRTMAPDDTAYKLWNGHSSF